MGEPSGSGDGVYVVQEEPTGLWVAGCCDRRCPEAAQDGGHHQLARATVKTSADRAATRHRRYLKTFPLYEPTRRRDICATCGQSVTANEELQRLVADLEAQLAQKTYEEAHLRERLEALAEASDEPARIEEESPPE